MTGKRTSSFSILAARILDGHTRPEDDPGTFGQMYGARGGNLTIDVGTWDNQGHNRVMERWTWPNYGAMEVKAGYIDFDTWAVVTGDAATSSVGTAGNFTGVPLWSQNSFNQQPRPVFLKTLGKDEQGIPTTVFMVLYSVQLTLQFQGPQIFNGLEVTYGGTSYLSEYDECGNHLYANNPRIGRFVIAPAGL